MIYAPDVVWGQDYISTPTVDTAKSITGARLHEQLGTRLTKHSTVVSCIGKVSTIKQSIYVERLVQKQYKNISL